jgi:hypothetical protein
MTSFQEERAAECRTLVTEILEFKDELNSWEQGFIGNMDDNLDKYGTKTFISDNQYSKIQEIYERVC